MTVYLRTAAGAAVALAFSVSLAAQWPSYPTPDVPRKDGKPVLDGPAPRTPDGKVDFNGIWQAGGASVAPGVVGDARPVAVPVAHLLLRVLRPQLVPRPRVGLRPQAALQPRRPPPIRMPFRSRASPKSPVAASHCRCSPGRRRSRRSGWPTT